MSYTRLTKIRGEGLILTKRILIVDDAMFMRKMLRAILEKGGYEVVGEAGNGIEAFREYERLKPDLVTLDITMPEMDGLEAVKVICAAYPTARIIMVSAMGQREMVVGAIIAGAKDFVVKPFDAGKVLESIKKVI